MKTKSIHTCEPPDIEAILAANHTEAAREARATQKPPERGLPCNPMAERSVLGAILHDNEHYDVAAGTLAAGDFALEQNSRIFRRMGELRARGEHIDRVTLYGELDKHGETKSVGWDCILSLDNEIPEIPNIDSYVRAVLEKSILRRVALAAQQLMNRFLEARNPSADILAEAEAVLAKLSEGQQKGDEWMNPGEIMLNYPGGIDAFLNPPRGGAGIALPWPALSRQLCGLHRGDLFLVAGRPSMGKSVVAMQMAYHAALHGEGVAYFSLEMKRPALIRRLVSAVGNINALRLRDGRLDRDERRRAAEAASQIDNLPLWINDERPQTVLSIISALRKLIARKEPRVRLVFVDHMQLMKSTGRFDSKHHELSEVSHSLKNLAGQLDVTVILLSQLNRECEKEQREPHLADLKETGSLEENADEVLFVHRPERYKPNDPTLKGQAKFIIAKQREGAIGGQPMTFQGEYQRFVEPARVTPGEEAANEA